MNHIIHVGFTGTQQGMSNKQKDQLRDIFEAWHQIQAHIMLHHGDCIGADSWANDTAWNFGFQTTIHPPTITTKRAYCRGDIVLPPYDYLTRNHHIVDASCMLIAAPSSDVEELRSGTWATVRYAKKRNVALVLLPR